ncbi:hypothetical protein LTR53_008620 [Teratosphaeriaceae sp. CCFEE 6253]|nr:hypothetical protein LTR53_008620 [Teratosphaeriaceae sp. CCFEE 6253]
MSLHEAFILVHPDQHGDQDDGTLRKAVRSRATAHSHRVSSRKGLRYAKYKQLPQEPLVPRPQPLPALLPAPAESLIQPSDNLSASHASVPSSPESGPTSVRVRTSRDLQVPNLLGPELAVRQEASVDSPYLHGHSPEEAAAFVNNKTRTSLDQHALVVAEPRRLPDPLLLNTGRRDPFHTYPVPYLQWFGPLLDFWYGVVIPKGHRLLKCPAAELEDYVVWSRRFELTEPALYYTSLYLATGIPVVDGTLHVNKALWLRQRAIMALNDALADPKRATSNAIISAVGKIALHEHTYGDRAGASRVHRAAQQRMIALRGGIQQLGLPNVTIQLMVWYDAYMAAETNTQAYFADLPSKLGVQSFSQEEAVRVTDAAAPRRHLHPGYERQAESHS